MELVIDELVRFFDGDADGCKPHSASMNSLFGEELALALLREHLREGG